MDPTELLRLLQLGDSALPVGATAHSFGLETLVCEGVLRPENIEQFLNDYLDEAGALEACFVRQAWIQCDLRKLNDELSALRPARESRDASLKLGRRFGQLVNKLAGAPVIPSDLHYCIAFGAAGGVWQIPEETVALAYLQQSIAGLVSACQRLMPLGQSAASQIVWNLNAAIVRAAARHTNIKEVWCFSPLPELGSMRHALIEPRLFIS